MRRFNPMEFMSARLSSLLIRLRSLTVFFIISAVLCPAQNPVSTEGWVVLPVADYTALRQAAFPDELKPEPPPVEATLTRVDYDLKVDGEGIFGQGRRLDADLQRIAAIERTQIVRPAVRDRHDQVGAAQKLFQIQSRGCERCFVSLVAEHQRPREKHHAGGVGVGEANDAGVGKRHGCEPTGSRR